MIVSINGRDKAFFESFLSLSYEQIAAMAGHNPTHNPSVTYKNARYPKEMGILIPGNSVTVQNGTIINVADTGNA